MEIVRFVVGVILPYVALAVFVVGMAYRIYTWRKLASPPMTLFPAPSDSRSNAVNTIEEAVLFKSLFKGDRIKKGLQSGTGSPERQNRIVVAQILLPVTERADHCQDFRIRRGNHQRSGLTDSHSRKPGSMGS